MFLENVVFDAFDPQLLGGFWEAALGAETLTDEHEGYETRLEQPGGPVLDLCFPRVPELPAMATRLHLAVRGDLPAAVDRLVGLGARRLDGAESLLDDVQGNRFRVVDRPADAGTGPLAALALESGDPARDGALWEWLSGWAPTSGSAPVTLRHPSGRGPLLELRLEDGPKGPGKNPIHLDLRLEPGDDPDEVARGIAERGGRELDPGWGSLPWRVYADASGNEFCVLPAPR